MHALDMIRRVVEEFDCAVVMIQNITLVAAVNSWKKEDHKDVLTLCLQKIEEIIDQPYVETYFLLSKDDHFRQTIFEYMLLYTREHKKVMKLGLDSKDIVIVGFVKRYLEETNQL